jgi:hypothetical protein
MAKANRTTSTPRRATAAKATKAAIEKLCRLEDEGFAEVENLRHLSALMALWGDHLGAARVCPERYRVPNNYQEESLGDI